MNVLNVGEPHYETNEDGITTLHPGYHETKCLECGARIFTVRNVPYRNLCGGSFCAGKRK